MPYGFYLDRLSGERAVAVSPEKRCIRNKNYEENFRSAEQETSLFAGKGQAAIEAEELRPWVDFLE
jgi:hypothetical protein